MGIFATVGKAISTSLGALGAAKPTPNNMPNGGDGVQAYGGFLLSPESRAELTGQLKWITYSNATNTAIVATGLRRTLDMLAGTEWHCEPNEAGGKDAARGVDIITKGLFKAQMDRPWSNTVRKMALYRYYGFALAEWCASKNDAAKQVVFTDIAHRPQYTIDRWDKPSEQMPWTAVSQLTNAGHRYVIPRGRLFYAVDDSLTDSPSGVGLMRHIVELVRRLGVLEGLEGLAYETDLRGMPIGRAPLGKIRAQALTEPGITPSQIEAFVAQRTQTMRTILAGIVKDPSRLQHLCLDSQPFIGADQNTFSSIQEWGLELLKGQSNGVAEVAAAIGRVQLEIARVLGIEFAMVGGNNSAGSHGMHADKTQFFAQNLSTILAEIASFATRDLARVLVGLNGLDPDTATPTLVAEPISLDAVFSTCQSLAELAKAGLSSDDEAIEVIRARLHLPDPPEPSPEMVGMLGIKRPAKPGLAAGRPDVKPADAPAPLAPDATTAAPDTKIEPLGPKPTGKRR